MMNRWEFEGEVVRYHEYDQGKFSSQIMIRGAFDDGTGSCIPVEFGAMVPKTVKASRLGLYKNVSCTGHFETYVRMTASGNMKQSRSCIVDTIEVKKEPLFGFRKK